MHYINDIDTDKRFDEIKFLNIDNDCIDPLNSFMLLNIQLLQPYGTKRVTPETHGRPDFLSYQIYGDTQYWWVILLYNNILDPDSLTSGSVISYPGQNALESLFQKASVLEKTK